MTLHLANRISNLPNYPFVEITAQVNRLKAAGKDVIRLDMGSPDMPPPIAVREKMAETVMKDEGHGYTGYRGIPEFRQAVARYYKNIFDVDLNPDTEVLPLLGSKEGLMNTTLALISPGDVVLVPDIGYPTYMMSTIMAQGEAYEMPLREANNFMADLSVIPNDVAAKARILWMNYPHNPTGVLATINDYTRAVEFCQKHDILLASDNPYFAVTFDGEKPISSLQAPNAKANTVEFMSMSKSHNMAGWRLGAAVGRADVIAALLQVKSNMDSGHFRPAYEAAVYALDTTPQSWIDERNEAYRIRRDMLLEAVPKMKLTVRTIPQGALYLWAVVDDGDDTTYCRRVREEAYVSIVPGSTYGSAGKGYVRIGLTTPAHRLAEAIERIVKIMG